MSGEPSQADSRFVDTTSPHPADGPGVVRQSGTDDTRPVSPAGSDGPSYPAYQPGPDGSYPAYQPGPDGTYPPYAGYPPGYVPPQPDRLTRLVARIHARTPRWLAPLAVFGCVSAAAGYVLWADPAAADANAQPTCIVKYLTGFDCPGCGGTRAVWYMMHGDIPAAARHHAVLLFAVPFVAYLYVAWAGKALFGWRLPSWEPSSRSLIWFLAAWAAFSVLRNLPWAPFTWFFV
ncbi:MULTISPECIES: DUF2752 domain-containing protein [Catenuloplanes]|uniref:DUF2752 domain-containing protein n=1 Tax=Catenuloplanes niger TaxID=587534 RepID=A0AAE4CUC4_9ACTN|nr:DUF2752 domain-containing protein [Catenuloplanes niger]MDR7324985.1 hypothetical protein [Catenuloplanes niger]